MVLCTPHSLHCEQIVRAAAAKKHVFCEKPLSLTRADAARAIEACRANGVALAVGHERRFEPPLLELQRLARAGELGTLLQVEANFSQDKFLAMAADNWRMSEKEAPAGPMTATGIHMLDFSIGLLGPARSVLARVRQLGSKLVNGDTLGVLVEFKSGANALISAILATPFDGRFAVYGSKGWAEVRDKAHPESPQGWTLTVSLMDSEKQVTEYPPAQAVLANLEAFADAAAGRAPYPVPQEQMLGEHRGAGSRVQVGEERKHRGGREKPMKLATFMMPLHPPGRKPAETLAEDREAILLADRLGFAEAFVGEHVTDLAENVTSCLMFLASVAHETKQIVLGSGTINMPNSHPAAIAAQVAMLDHMLKGRFIMGISPGGLMSDAEVFGNYQKDRNAIFLESINMVLEIWKGEGPYDLARDSSSTSRPARP